MQQLTSLVPDVTTMLTPRSLDLLQHVSDHHLLLFQFLPPHPSSSSLTAIREKNNHIDRADKLEQESENMNSHMCQRQSEEEEEWTDISVCLIVVLIL